MGLACRGITHCSECGTTLKFGELGICKECAEQEINKQNYEKENKKVYKGYELIKEIAEGNIKERNKVLFNR